MHILVDVFNDVIWYMMRGGLLLGIAYWGFASTHDVKKNRIALSVTWTVLIGLSVTMAALIDGRSSSNAQVWQRIAVTVCECFALGSLLAFVIDRPGSPRD